MNIDLFDFDDWGSFMRRGLLIVLVVALGVLVVVTLALWMHGVVSQPVLSPTTTAIIAQPRNASEWFGLSLVSGALFGIGALVLGLVLLCIAAFLAILGQGLEARRVLKTSISDLSIEASQRAESSTRGGADAT